MSRCDIFWSHLRSARDDKHYPEGEKMLGRVLHIVCVMGEALILVVFGVVFDRHSELFKTRLKKKYCDWLLSWVWWRATTASKTHKIDSTSIVSMIWSCLCQDGMKLELGPCWLTVGPCRKNSSDYRKNDKPFASSTYSIDSSKLMLAELFDGMFREFDTLRVVNTLRRIFFHIK